MKTFFPLLFLMALIGVAIGYQIPRTQKTDFNTENTIVRVSEKETIAKVGELKDLISDLKKENNLLRHSLDEEISSDTAFGAENHEVLRKQWIDGILRGSGEGSLKNSRDIMRLAKRLNLTPDQVIQLELLSEQRNQQQRLKLLKILGMIDRGSNDYADIQNFKFDESLQNILSEEQKDKYEKQNNRRKEQSYSMMASVMTGRYQLNNPESYSAGEQKTINESFKKALNRDIEIKIPDAINELSLNSNEKRILAAAYENMEPQLFEKVYESIIDNRGKGGFGGRRGGDNLRGERPPDR